MQLKGKAMVNNQARNRFPGFKKKLILTALLAFSGVFSATAGERQSPINIITDRTVEANLPGIVTTYSSNATLGVVNTYNPNRVPLVPREWATLKANVPAGSFVMLGSQQYDLLQFHFHTPSEHLVNNRSTAMEIHFVHLRSGYLPCDPDALMVIGARIKRGAKNTELGKLFGLQSLPSDSTSGSVPVANFNLNKVLPEMEESWRYPGSLTAPSTFSNCTAQGGTVDEQLSADVFPENVSWVLLTKDIQMSAEQIKAFQALFIDGNSRPIQPLNSRIVKRVRQ
jgi:carbonic anhydrase